jgi:hypothetical protein
MRIPLLLIGPGLLAAVLANLSLTPSATATSGTFGISANGAKEVLSNGTPNQGDPDGTATGTLTLDNGTGSGSTGSATFSITLSNIDITTLSGHHIHVGASTTTGGIVLDFGDPDNIRTGSLLTGMVTGLSATQITTILSNSTNFYYNIHNGAFPGGAVREQLPEPGALGLLTAVASVVLGTRRLRRRSAETLG